MLNLPFLATSALFLGLAFGFGFDFDPPVVTPISTVFDADGWTPRPPSYPLAAAGLAKRLEDPALCGFLEGNLSKSSRS